MTTQDALARIQSLWAGDAVHDVTPLWRSISRETDDPGRIVELIEEAGRIDGALEVDPDTLAAMREVATSIHQGNG